VANIFPIKIVNSETESSQALTKLGETDILLSRQNLRTPKKNPKQKAVANNNKAPISHVQYEHRRILLNYYKNDSDVHLNSHLARLNNI